MFKALTLLGLVAVAIAGPAAEKVAQLPQMGNGPWTFDAYSGMLPIPNTKKQLHYMFVESQNDPVNDPLVIWFNGGPGCSSMLGFLQEHGPYVMESGTTNFVENQYSWNKEASVLYIESPAGVGYSICGETLGCSYTDTSSAADNLQAILAWYTKFPEFQPNELYISGESYAGIYVPYVSYQIHQYNLKNAANPNVYKPNLKGYMVGNGCTNWDFDTNPAYVEMAFWHGLYDMDMYDGIQANDCSSQYGAFSTDITPVCQGYLDTFNTLTQDINIYDVYGICYYNGQSEDEEKADKFELYQSSDLGLTKVGDEIKAYKKSWSAADYTPWAFKNQHTGKKLKELPPCTFGNPLITYMNQADVRTALNIPAAAQAWDFCTNSIRYNIGTIGSQWVYSELRGLYRILFYSGDTDGAVPTYGSLQWINQLDWEITDQWRPYYVDDQVAGYIEQRDGLTFATVHGAGHMVPQDKREQAYYLIFNWLKSQPV